MPRLTIESGLAGIHGAGVIERTATGYTSTNYGASYRPAADVLPDLADGGYIIAKHDVLADDPSAAVRAPLLAPELEPDAVSPFDGATGAGSLILEAFAQGSAEQRGLAALAKAEPRAYDKVGVRVFAHWWHGAGARVGVRRGDRVQWLDGTETPLADAAAVLDGWRTAGGVRRW